MPVYQLDDDLWFPDPYLSDNKPGLIAVGGDLRPERLLLAYTYGFFPWFSFKDADEPHWYCPLDRFVIFPDEIHVSHSMKSLINKNRYRVSFNHDFRHVIGNCAVVANRNKKAGAWLGPDIIRAYTEMHRLGFAKSVEVWEKNGESREERLVGGLYGIMLNNAFFGESMFSLVPDASKLALIFLARKAQADGWKFIDCQYETPHLLSMGGRHITYNDYLKILLEK